MDKSKEIKELEELCKPVVDYLRENYNPYYGIVITDEGIKLMNVEIGIPMHREIQ